MGSGSNPAAQGAGSSENSRKLNENRMRLVCNPTQGVHWGSIQISVHQKAVNYRQNGGDIKCMRHDFQTNRCTLTLSLLLHEASTGEGTYSR